MKRIEPAAGLANVLNDVIAGAVGFEPLAVLERVVSLSKWHRTRFKPAVEHLWHATHGRAPGWVIWVWAGQLVNGRAVKVVDSNAEIGLKLVERTVDVETRVVRVV